MVGNYALKGGEQFNMVLLVPEDIPEGGATTIEGNVDERQESTKTETKVLFLTIPFLPPSSSC